MENLEVNSTNRKMMRNPLNPPIEQLALRFGGENPKELERFLKFAVVGLIGAVIDLGLLTISQSTFLPPTSKFNVGLATTIAFVSAVISNFIWTTLWVYPDSQTNSKKKQLVQFAFISVIGWIARTLWVTTMFSVMGELFMPLAEPLARILHSEFVVNQETTNQLGSLIAQLIAMVFVMFWNFFANRYWTYNDVE